MKNIIFLWFLIFFTNCESQNIQYKKHKTDWEKENLRGKVKSICIVNSLGEKEYLYNGEGYLIEETVYLEDGEKLRRNILYTKKGNKIKEIGYNKKGKEEYYSDYKYNKYGYLKEWVTYAQGKLYKKLVYNYDSKGNESEVYLYYNKDKFDEKITQKYDLKNRLIEMEIFSNRKEYIEKKEYLYDQENHLVSIILKNDNIIVSKNIFRYDTNNNITEEQNYRDSTLIDTKTYIYSYDSHNNWTKKFLLQDLDKEVLIEERKIIYYE